MCFNGLNILIIVVGQGIGCVFVLVVVVEGVIVYVMDINSDVLVLFFVENLSIRMFCFDVMKQVEIDVLVVKLLKLDGLFNCVGIVYNGIVFDIIDVDWVFVFEFNVMVMMCMCCVFLLGMLEWVGEIGIVFILNMVFMVFFIKGFVNWVFYGVIKVVVIGLIKFIVVDFVK